MVTESRLTSDPPQPEQLSAFQLIAARPLVVVAAAFACGIALVNLSIYALAVVAALLLAAESVASFRYKAAWPLLAATTSALLMGAYRSGASWTVDNKDVSRFVGKGYVTVAGAVRSDVDVREDFFVCEVQVGSVTLPDGSRPAVNGRVLLRLKRGKEELGYADSVQVRGPLQLPPSATNPGAFDYRTYLIRKGIYCTLTARRPANWNRFDGPSSALTLLPRLAGSCKRSLKSGLARVLSPIDAGLATGIILGGKGDLPGPVVDDFISTGTVHILSASGMNVAMTAGLLWSLGRRLRLRRKPASWLIVTGLIFYVLMAGGSPSVLRAFVMALAFLFAPLLDREPDMPCAIAAAALILLAIDPGWLFDSGFQLSFAAVIAIVALMPIGESLLTKLPSVELSDPWLSRTSNRILRGTAIALMVSLAAQIGTWPLLARYYDQISLSAIPANALIFWAIGLIMAFGFVVWPLALLITPFAKVLTVCVVGPLLAFMIGIAGFFGAAPGLSRNVEAPGALAIALYYGVAIAAVGHIRKRLERPLLEPAL